MARKESITIQMILDTAFEMTREEGFANVTARRVAAKAGCSTQPIFRVYKNMEELWEAVYERAAEYFQDYCALYPRLGETPFSNLGMAYITFAREERHLFELLFLNGPASGEDGTLKRKSLYELLDGPNGNVAEEISWAREDGCGDADGMFRKIWLIVHGAACLSLIGDYDLTDMQTWDLLEQYYCYFAETNEEE